MIVSSATGAALRIDVSYSENPSGAVCVIAPYGEVDASKAPTLTAQFNQLLGDGEQRFVIDMSGVTFIDSSGISSIVHLFKRVRIGHGDVKLAAIVPEVLKVLTLIRLDRVFEIFPDVAAARDSYGS
jgi:anti-sigma B factor antagonist